MELRVAGCAVFRPSELGHLLCRLAKLARTEDAAASAAMPRCAIAAPRSCRSHSCALDAIEYPTQHGDDWQRCWLKPSEIVRAEASDDKKKMVQELQKKLEEQLKKLSELQAKILSDFDPIGCGQQWERT